MSDNPAVDREQLATVLEQIAEHSSADDIRAHIRQVSMALRGNGLIFVNGPAQQKMRDEAVR